MSRFLAPYRQFFLKATDAPFEYGEASALATLSIVALGRRWLDYGKGIKPNLFMMLVGDSSVARKSTSVEFSKSLIQEVDDQRVGPRDYTVEGLIRWMQEKDPITKKGRNKVGLFAEEFGADLARMEAYAGTMATDFCALYDGESFDKVRAKAGTMHVHNPRVTLFAAAAYPMLSQYLRPKDWMSGFLMRFLYVAPGQMRQQYAIQPPYPYAEFRATAAALKILRDDLRSKPIGLRLDAAAEQLFTQAISQFAAPGGNNLTHVAQTYRARFGVSVLKLALLYQLDIDPFAPVCSLALQQAFQFAFSTCWPSFLVAYQKTALEEFNGLFFSVYTTLQQYGSVSQSDLSKLFFANETLGRVLGYMKGMGLVRVARPLGPTGPEMLSVV